MSVDLTRIPFFLFADTPEQLQRLCFNNNATNEKMYDYHVITPTPQDPRWGVWFITSGEKYKRPEPIPAVDRKGVEHGG